MYDELVRQLRSVKDTWQSKEEQAMIDAADAIEELSAKQTPMQVDEIHLDEYFCPSCGAENNCDQGYVQDAYCPVCGQRLWAEPLKEES